MYLQLKTILFQAFRDGLSKTQRYKLQRFREIFSLSLKIDLSCAQVQFLSFKLNLKMFVSHILIKTVYQLRILFCLKMTTVFLVLTKTGRTTICSPIYHKFHIRSARVLSLRHSAEVYCFLFRVLFKGACKLAAIVHSFL